jgi:p24 family protein delta-1
LAQKEHLKPIEAELKVLEDVMKSIVDEMEYLKEREVKMRDTNGFLQKLC